MKPIHTLILGAIAGGLVGLMYAETPPVEAKGQEPVVIDVAQLERDVATLTPVPEPPPIPKPEPEPSPDPEPASRVSENPPSLAGLPQFPEPEPTQVIPSFVESIYPVRVKGTSTDPQTYGAQAESHGSAVAVAVDKLRTAKHLLDRITNYTIEIQVGESWVSAKASLVAKKDLLVLRTEKTELKFVPVRVPTYGERVTVYGLKTKSLAQGQYVGAINAEVGNGLVPLEIDQTKVEQGDSGGGIFGDDGALLGTISGYMQDSPQITSMVPIVVDPPAPGPFAAAPAPKAAQPPPPAAQSSNCPGGVCRPQQAQNWTYSFPSGRQGRKR